MNIVTIDFDIIMAPSIELYSNFEFAPRYDEHYLKIFNADLKTYNKLTNWLMSQLPTLNRDDICFISAHDQIVNAIPRGVEDINLINIDHHHDFGYGNCDEIMSPNYKYNLDCGNWALFLMDNERVNSYTWIRNKNSADCPHHKYPYSTKLLDNYDLSSLKADKIVICLSDPWVPEQYHTLFYLWMDIAGKLNQTEYYL